MYKNVWNVRVYPGDEKANHDMWKELHGTRGNKAICWHDLKVDEGYVARGSMAATGSAALEIRIFREDESIDRPEGENGVLA